uniref:NADH dehydrogenase subunit 4L n=1 Tax=Bipalium adventitium TaxID=66751 RepID=A0A8K1X741_9PLAT|nr:NADH dehydrogenase subunit 4L [Bipalium adventitium]
MLYYYSFRFLNFLISVEISLIFLFMFFSLFTGNGEMSYMLIILSVIACGVAVGLSVLVSWLRFYDKNVSILSNLGNI